MNKVILIGRLTKDPDTRTTPSGIEVCRFTLAVNRNYKGEDGESQADFLPIVAWRKTAELCGKYLSKGRQCAVEGSIQTRSYEDSKGEKRYVTEVIAERVEFLGDKQSQDAPKQQSIHDLPTADDDDSLPF